jgi:hypothetical protein
MGSATVLCDADVNVHIPGELLPITIAADFCAFLIGPVVQIAEGHLSPDFLTEEKYIIAQQNSCLSKLGEMADD